MSLPNGPSEFSIHRCTALDTPVLADLMHDSFVTIPACQELIMGCTNGKSKTHRIASEWSKSIDSDPTDIWIKVVAENASQSDDEAGGMGFEKGENLAAAQWKLYLTCGGGEKMPVPHWLEGEKKAQAEILIEGMNESRILTNSDPYLYLHILFTAPKVQGRGLGSMMVQWGCRLADLLEVGSSVEGSVDGQALYRKFGYQDEGEEILVDGSVVGIGMRRAAAQKGSGKI